MKGPLLIPVIFLTLLAGAAAQEKKPAGGVAPPSQEDKQKDKKDAWDALPDEVYNRELKDLEGQSFFLSNHRGQVLVINIWATWCGPCHIEIPELNKLHKDYSGRGVEFVGMTTENREEDGKKVRDFVRKFEMKYKVVWPDKETTETLLAGNYSIPQTLVVAPDGKVIARFRGYSKKSPQLLRESIEKALNPAAGR